MKLSANAHEQNVERRVRARRRFAPHRLDDFIARNDAPVAPRKKRNDVVLARGERNSFSANFDRAPLAIDRERSIRAFCFERVRAASSERAHSRAELVDRKWFSEVIVRARIEPRDARAHVALRGQQQNRQIQAAFALARAPIEPRSIGQSNVDHRNVEVLRADRIGCLRDPARNDHRVTLRAKSRRNDARNALAVFDEQNAHARIVAGFDSLRAVLKRAWRWLVLVVLALVPIPLAAQTGQVRLSYSAPSSCADTDAFAAQVRARSPRIRFGDSGDRSLRVRVEIGRKAVVGRLVLRDADGTDHERQVRGHACAEVVAGLALVAAIAIDPLAASADAGPPPAVTYEAFDAGDLETPDASADATIEDDASAEETDAHFSGSIAANAEIATGVLPNVLFAVPVSFELSRETDSLFAPAVRVRFAASAGNTHTAGTGADFWWVSGELDVCPVAQRVGNFRFQLCARTEVGARNASGYGVTPSRTSLRGAAALGPILDIRLFFGRFFVDLEGGALFSLGQDHYFLDPNIEVFRAPLIGARAGLGFGVVIW